MRKFLNSTSDLWEILNYSQTLNTKDWTTKLWSQLFSMKIIVLDLKEKKQIIGFKIKAFFQKKINMICLLLPANHSQQATATRERR